MLIAEQTEERTLLSIKCSDSHMDFSICTLKTRTRQERPGTRSTTFILYSCSEESRLSQTRRLSNMNNEGQLSPIFYPERDPTVKVWTQVSIAMRNIHCKLKNTDLCTIRRHLIAHSAHEFPFAVFSFADLGSAPYTYTES